MSPLTLREVERASSKRLPVLSIRMDATALRPDLEYFLSANHWLDASGRPIEQILSELIKAVQGCARHNRNLVSGTVDSSDAGAQRDPAQASGGPKAQRPSRLGSGPRPHCVDRGDRPGVGLFCSRPVLAEEAS
jgi:hypothetical protein